MTTRLLQFALCIGLVSGCNDKPEPAAAKPVPRSIEVGTPPRADRPRIPAQLTDADREVIAYLDGWEPLQQELRDGFISARKLATATRMDIARRRPAEPKIACDAIAAVLERNRAWHSEHPVPDALGPGKLDGYQSTLLHRQSTKGEDLESLRARISHYLDGRGDFERRDVRQLEGSAEDLKCAAQ